MSESEPTGPDAAGSKAVAPTPSPPEAPRDVRALALRARLQASLFDKPFQPLRIGRFALLDQIGEGAMGLVYAAYDDQLDRRVALKLVKRVGSEQARKRMLREGQAMAKLSHPNVVPVFEVGEHEGLPFVAMEFVRGPTLKRWRDHAEPGWRDVLHKYLQAGGGLAAAHAAGLVHRDFKPHNAIVGPDGRVRVVDFGLAARAGELEGEAPAVGLRPQDAALDTALTETGAVVGTPAYMAPEQFLGADVDASSDQFSFCVALWEALFGGLPFAGKTIAALSEAVSRGEVEAPPRDTGVPSSMAPVLRQGLAVDPAQRWPSMDALLERLEGLDVDPARARRRRRTIVGVTVGGLALAGGGIGGQRALDARRAGACADEATDGANAIWNDDIRARVDSGLRDSGLPNAAVTGDKALPWLDSYAEEWQSVRAEACTDTRVDERWTEDDLARVYWCLDQQGMTFAALTEELQAPDQATLNGAVPAAAALRAPASCSDVDVLRRLTAPPDAEQRHALADSLRELSKVQALEAMGKYPEGLESVRGVLENAEHVDSQPLIVRARMLQGRLLDWNGEYEDAASVLEDAYFAAVNADDYATASLAAGRLTYTLGSRLDQHEAGYRWFRHASAALEKLGVEPDHPDAIDALSALAGVQMSAGDYATSIATRGEVIAARERALGPTHPKVAVDLDNLGVVQTAVGNYTEAEAAHGRALEIKTTALGSDHPLTATAVYNLAGAHLRAGSFARALDEATHVLRIREKVLSPDHPDIAGTRLVLGAIQSELGDFESAKQEFERALAAFEAKLGPEHPMVASTLSNLALIHDQTGEDSAAVARFRRALGILERSLGPDHPRVGTVLNNMGNLELGRGRYDEAKRLLERALTIVEAALGSEHDEVAQTLVNLGNVEAGLGDHAAAKTRFVKALSVYDRVISPDHPLRANCLKHLADAHDALGEQADALAAYEEALAIFDANDGVEPGQPEAQFKVARVLFRIGDDRERALSLAESALEGYRSQGKSSGYATGVERWLEQHRGGSAAGPKSGQSPD